MLLENCIGEGGNQLCLAQVQGVPQSAGGAGSSAGHQTLVAVWAFSIVERWNIHSFKSAGEWGKSWKVIFKILYPCFPLIILLKHIKMKILRIGLILHSPPFFTQLHPIPPWLAQQLIRGSCLSLLFDGAALACAYLGPLLMDFTGVGIRKTARHPCWSWVEWRAVTSSSCCFSKPAWSVLPYWRCSHDQSWVSCNTRGRVPSVCLEP